MNDFNLLVAQYDSTLPALADGQSANLQVDQNGRLLVQADITVVLDHTNDSVQLGDGTNLLTSTTVGADIGLDVNIINASVPVSATDLDIRDLSASQDNVAISDGTNTLVVNADGSLNITDNGGSLTVDATDLDIRDLDAAQDSVQSNLHDGSGTAITSTGGALDINVASGNLSVDLDHTEDSVRLGDGTSFFTSTSENGDLALDVHISNSNIEVTQGTSPWVIGDGGGSITVDAVDLDIRDLSASQDSVAISDGTDTLEVNADGSINVGNTVTVQATDLDIRDLSAASDSVSIGDGTDTLEINSDGSINVVSSAVGDEQYSVTDALAAGGDGLLTITATATPFVTVASYSHVSGTAYIYGYQWECDQNAQAQLVYFNGTAEIVYKNSLNSSAMPGRSEHFSEGGKIEIPGVASGEIRLKIKKRKAAGGDANGSGSIHIRSIA